MITLGRITQHADADGVDKPRLVQPHICVDSGCDLVVQSAAMTWQSQVQELFERIQRELHAVIEGIDPLLLDEPPAPGANSIGWLAWHLTRSHDRNVSELQGREQLWILEGWHTRFSREPDPAETGFGHTPDQAAAFRSPESGVVLAYHDAVVDMIHQYLAHAPEDDLDREAFRPTFGDTRTVQQRLAGVVTDALQHVGQLAYAKGILEAVRNNSSGPESR